ncbi:MAG: hypothetical protein IJK53_05035 [Erysipelotrichaceae bacterium]|nr:hypothetical protein [Erysipelotrichaceae bacterium]
MNVIEELVHYCKEERPLGALLFTGEWGSGKTHVIENELKEALGDAYAIVRVSLYGVSTVDALHDAIRRQYISVCYPFANRILESKERTQNNSGFSRFLQTLIGLKNPILGTAADLFSSVNIVNMITIKPEYEDLKTMEKRKVILVFDDLERCNVDMVELLGVVNDYCENQMFNTIVVTNLQYLIVTMEGNIDRLRMLKGKTVSQTVSYQPDYRTIIHRIINEREWRSEEYKDFLSDSEEAIVEVFASPAGKKSEYEKPHNLLTLIIALQEFYRLFYHIRKKESDVNRDLLTSFIPYMLCKNNPVFRQKEPVFDIADDQIAVLYPEYHSKDVFPSVRQWIDSGVFDEEAFYKELDKHTKKQ